MVSARDRIQELRVHGGAFAEIAADIEKELDQHEQDIEGLIGRLRKLELFAEPPNSYAAFDRVLAAPKERKNPKSGKKEMKPALLEVVDEGSGRHYAVYAVASVNVGALGRGQRLRVTADFHVIEALDEFAMSGQVGTIENILPDRRVIVRTSADAIEIFRAAASIADAELVRGHRVLYDHAMRFVFAVIPIERQSALRIESVEAVEYSSIGGLEKQVLEFEDKVMRPRLAPQIFGKYKLRLPKGAVLYGPPGCGKTLLARAIAHRFQQMGQRVTFFIGHGPEFLIKWVGDSEHKVREPAEYAKAHSDELVFYLIDEFDSVARARGTFGGHAGVNDSIVTQFNAILDGFIKIPNLFFIGITNRLDLIDSSILRPGRLDLHVKIPRPTRASALEILRIYLPDDIPLHPKYSDPKHPEYKADLYAAFEGKPERITVYLIEQTVEHVYGSLDNEQTPRQEMARIEYDTGGRQTLWMRDFVSGSLLQDIMERAKLVAARREADGGEGGVRLKDLHDQTDIIFRERRDEINRSNSQEWARMADLPVDRPFRVLSITEAEPVDSGFSGKA